MHEITNDNGLRLINFVASKNLIMKSTCFKYKDIDKMTCAAPNGIMWNQIDHVLIDKRRHTNVTDVRVFRGVDCGSNHSLD